MKRVKTITKIFKKKKNKRCFAFCRLAFVGVPLEISTILNKVTLNLNY